MELTMNLNYFSIFAPETDDGALAHLARAQHWQC